jgi:hypothetical protein
MRMTLEFAVRAAIEVLAMDKSDDGTVSRKLSEVMGISINSASTLVTFIPLACARFWLAGSPLRFTPTYLQSDESGNAAQRKSFERNSIFRESYRQAQQLIGAEDSNDKLLTIASRSPEFQAINAALHDGARLEDLELAEPIVAFDDVHFSPAG